MNVEFRVLKEEDLRVVAGILGMPIESVEFIVGYNRSGAPQEIYYSPFYEYPRNGEDTGEPIGNTRSVLLLTTYNSRGCQPGYKKVRREYSDGSVSVQCRKC